MKEAAVWLASFLRLKTWICGKYGSLSTVVGDLSLTSRENQIGSLYFDVQSDENFCFKVLEVSKAESLTLNVLDEFVSGF